MKNYLIKTLHPSVLLCLNKKLYLETSRNQIFKLNKDGNASVGVVMTNAAMLA